MRARDCAARALIIPVICIWYAMLVVLVIVLTPAALILRLVSSRSRGI